MRDINRIDTICAQLAAAWKKYPDLRLGQLICNSVKNNLFYIEDNDLIKSIENFCKIATPETGD